MQMTDWPAGTLGVALFSYLLGGLCTGYYLVRSRTGENIGELGSGSAGARNAGRRLGPAGFVTTFAGDFAKGAAAVGLARYAGLGAAGLMAALLAVVLGHLYPVQLHFRGGKGVATAFGAILVMDYRLALLPFAVFLVLLAATRRWTVSGMIAVVLLPVVALILRVPRPFLVGVTVAALLILLAHKSNICRLIESRRSGKPAETCG